MTDPETKPASILLADLVENNRNALLERWTQTIERTLAPKPLTQLELLNRIRSRFSTRDDDETVLLEVKNQSPPLQADDIPSLFEPFQRGSNARPETGKSGSRPFYRKTNRSRTRWQDPGLVLRRGRNHIYRRLAPSKPGDGAGREGCADALVAESANR